MVHEMTIIQNHNTYLSEQVAILKESNEIIQSRLDETLAQCKKLLKSKRKILIETQAKCKEIKNVFLKKEIIINKFKSRLELENDMGLISTLLPIIYTYDLERPEDIPPDSSDDSDSDTPVASEDLNSSDSTTADYLLQPPTLWEIIQRLRENISEMNLFIKICIAFAFTVSLVNAAIGVNFSILMLANILMQ